MESYTLYSPVHPFEVYTVPEFELANFLNRGLKLEKPNPIDRTAPPVLEKPIKLNSTSFNKVITSLIALGIPAETALKIEKGRPYNNAADLLTVGVGIYSWERLADKVIYD